MLLGFEIGQRWPEAVMHSCGSYFVPVPKRLFVVEMIELGVLKSMVSKNVIC